MWEGKLDKPTETRWMVMCRRAKCSLDCFRLGTENTASEPVHELLVQTLRDAQQSVDASALQVCYWARKEDVVLGFG